MFKTLQDWQRLFIIIGIVIIGAVGTAGYLASKRQPHFTPFMRGEYLAQQLGCFACHGPGGIAGNQNPGALWGAIPPLSANGAITSFIQNEQEIREWILYGAPRRLWIDDDTRARPTNVHRGNGVRTDPKAPLGLIPMPAFKGLVSEGDLEDLVVFVTTVAKLQLPAPPEAEEGRRIASRLGCFGCHGPGGRGGSVNPASFKGYIPPWDGEDFEEIVQDEDELKQWILEGKIDRFEANPLATYFTQGQIIQMPAYRNILKEGELEAIISYIEWLRDVDKQITQSWVDDIVPAIVSEVERGHWLYRQTGCVACHGPEGEGGVENKNAAGGFVPTLNDLAEKMELFEKEEVDAVVAVIERGLDPDDPSIPLPLPDPDGFRSLYSEVRDLILQGGHPRKRDKKESPPPIVMPAWRFRLHADGGPASRADINAIIAYLLNLQTFEEDEEAL